LLLYVTESLTIKCLNISRPVYESIPRTSYNKKLLYFCRKFAVFSF